MRILNDLINVLGWGGDSLNKQITKQITLTEKSDDLKNNCQLKPLSHSTNKTSSKLLEQFKKNLLVVTGLLQSHTC